MRQPSEHERRTDLLQRVIDCARQRLGADEGAALAPFLRRYWARAPLVDLDARRPEALLGAALGHRRLAEVRPAGTALVRAYHPDESEDGWASEHTVLEIVVDDMPFLVDSVTCALARRDLRVAFLVHPILRVRRDADGRLQAVLDTDGWREGGAESFMHVEVGRQPRDAMADIERAVLSVLADVRAAVGDWFVMRGRLEDAIADLPVSDAPGVIEARQFLQWLRENNFTFLGYRRLAVSGAAGESDGAVRIESAASAGLLRDPAVRVFDDFLGDGMPLPPALAAFVRGPEALAVTKGDRISTVHRAAAMDTVWVKRPTGADGTGGAHVFAGLFSANVYNRSVRSIPLLRRKLARVLERSGFEPRSHDGRALANIVETFPRDELFQIGEDALLQTAIGLLELKLRPRVAVFLRRDEYERFVSCLVYVPRDRYHTQLRLVIQAMFERAFAGRLVGHYLQMGDEPLARLHLIVRTTPGRIPEVSATDLEAEIARAARTWPDALAAALVEDLGEAEGGRLFRRYADAFPVGYRDRFTAEQAVTDVGAIERAVAGGRLGLALWRPADAAPAQFRLKIYQPERPLVLSDLLPILEHLGLRVVDEVPHTVALQADGGRPTTIHDLGVETRSCTPVALAGVEARFVEAFLAVWEGEAESDGLNALVVTAGLDVHQVAILRAYVRYLRQTVVPFTQAYLERVLTGNPGITGDVVRLFLALFDPDAAGEPESRAEPLRASIATALDAVESAEDDRILRRFLNLVEATLRTNWFQREPDGSRKPTLALKLDSRRIDDLPLPRPMVEIFVCSPRVEGIHLRGGRVARGGIRWSDRREDYRTEVLGLMKAQMVKNAVIVPVGAKGGFVVKRPPDPSDREAWQAEGVACYRSFIRGLLDLTDTRRGEGVDPPPRVVRRDADDPYLVVAADKGTAAFSDIANAVAGEYGFWLGDAFASGGSVGYDHKAMGITARGAWEGIRRHFRELGRDIQREDFTVVGVGDMSGDVFGNGMLLSEHIRLLAAFDHRHVFVDPDPDAAASFAERTRLFAQPRSSWLDYDPARLSPGGAVYDRRAKQLTPTPQIRARFAITAERLTPAELIRILLAAEVDLLWFGGIGTYVKSTDEQHAEVGDRGNDALRIDGRELRCRVVGEGANLAVTQQGRIEYARRGGRINTDFIDNSAGVDCSDHEVNIKILLDAVVADGGLAPARRNALLAEMTDEVAALVLRDNYLQTQALSVMEAEGPAGLEGNARLMRMLERQGRLNRAVEFLPDEDALAERAAKRQSLTRPELAVLFSYGKIWLAQELLESDLPDDGHLTEDAVRYFPTPLQTTMREPIGRHRLRRELISTSITNSLVNRMGGAFVADVGERTGRSPVDIARAYIIAREVWEVRPLWADIETLDDVVPAGVQRDLQRAVQALVERGTLWFLRNGGTPLDISVNMAAFAAPVSALAGAVERVLPEAEAERLRHRAATLAADGVPPALARRVARLPALPAACDIVRIAAARGVDQEAVARLYFGVGLTLGFGWLRERAERLPAAGHWQRLAVSAIVEELYSDQRDVTNSMLVGTGAAHDGAFAAWSARRPTAVERSRALLAELQQGTDIDLPMLTVASRQLRALCES